jgi:hypothetical protein
MQEWFSPAEIAELKLPGTPGTKMGVNALADRNGWREAATVNNDPLARKRKGRGGGWEYHWSLLPIPAQTALQKREIARKKAAKPQTNERGSTSARVDWEWFEAIPDTRKKKAQDRCAVLDAICMLQRGALSKDQAVCIISGQQNIGASTIYNWFKLVEGLDRKDWLPALCPRHAGRTAKVECDPQAWEFLKRDWLTTSKPPFTASYKRLSDAAKLHDWVIPAARTLERRLMTDIPSPVRVLMREGEEALSRMYPPMIRDRRGLQAMEAINADGHKWDLWVEWPDGSVHRPVMMAIQDLYSNVLLAWRIDKTENVDLVRLTFGDLFRYCGIPEHALLDNGRGFAAKCITGGQPTRKRFKIKAEDPIGILTGFGVQVHWATPGHGQEKAIERMFLTLEDHIGRHPVFVGAYAGNCPGNKPEGAGTKPVKLETFLQYVGEGIRAYNAEPNRQSQVAKGTGKSYDQLFEESVAEAVIARPEPEMLRQFLLAVESVSTHREDGSFKLFGNTYWDECLLEHTGTKITVRFDPDYLHEDAFAYRLDGRFIGAIGVREAAGFFSREAAREHTRKRRAFCSLQKALGKSEIDMSIAEYMALQPVLAEVEPEKLPPLRPRLIAGASPMPAEIETIPDDEFQKRLGHALSVIEGGLRDE